MQKKKSEFVFRRAARIRMEAQRDLSEMLVAARCELGLSRRQLARRMDYESENRGAWKVAQWELQQDIPRGDRPEVLARALEIDVEVLLAFLDTLEFSEQLNQTELLRRRVARNVTLCHAEDLFASQIPRLVEYADVILEHPEWRNVKVISSGSSIAYWGGEHWSLANLLLGWRQDLQLPCPVCTGVLRIYFIGGSPLSGRHQALGHCEHCAQVHSTKISREVGITSFVSAARRRQKQQDSKGGASLITLEQVLVAIGATLPDVVIQDADENPVAEWSPATATISTINGTTILALVDRGDPRTNRSATWRRRTGSVRHRGRLRIGDLRTLAGPWRGDVIEFEGATGERYTLHPGFVTDSDKQIISWFDGVVPVEVAMWAVDALAPA